MLKENEILNFSNLDRQKQKLLLEDLKYSTSCKYITYFY